MKRKHARALFLAGVWLLIGVLAPVLAGCGAATPATAVPGTTSTAAPASPTTTAIPTEAVLALTITQPQDNAVVSTDKIDVKGRTGPGAVVSANDEIGSADNEGNFSLTIGLEEGANVIEVFASDEAGKEAGVTLIVTLVK